MSTGPKPGTIKAGTFDAFRLAHERGSLHGKFDAATSDRLYAWLAEGEAPVTWTITGAADAVGRPAIAIEIEATVPLECQRCLAAMEMPGKLVTGPLLATDDADMHDADADNSNAVLL